MRIFSQAINARDVLPRGVINNYGEIGVNREYYQTVFDRIIADSQHIVAGNYEAALADIIDLLENPPATGGVAMPSVQLTYRISKTLREGLAGLPPDGFEFCLWLWDVAPLHAVSVGEMHDVETVSGFRFGVIHLRKIASLVAGLYIAQQPQKISSVIELIDSSVSWVDARNLVNHALIDHFTQHFNKEKETLRNLAGGKSVPRKLVPLGTVARLMADEKIETAEALDFVRLVMPDIKNELIYRAVVFILRIGGMYGDYWAVLEFLASLDLRTQPEYVDLICEFLRNPKLQWETIDARRLTPLLRSWQQSGIDIDPDCYEKIAGRLQSRDAA